MIIRLCLIKIVSNGMMILRKYDSSLLLSEYPGEFENLLFTLTVKVLSIHDIMHCVHQTVFVHNARSDTTKFSHLGTDTEKKTNMDTHCTNICSSFTRDPENTQSGLQCQDCNKKMIFTFYLHQIQEVWIRK